MISIRSFTVHLMIVSLLGSLLSVAMAQPKKEKLTILGDWEVVKMTVGGSEMKLSEVERIGYCFKADGSFVRLRGNKESSQRGTYVQNPEVEPATVDIDVMRNGKPFARYKGIYRIKDNTLILVMAMEVDGRPMAFESPKGENVILHELKRVKK
jgi:uncharacterized protein (TIGR03067 family)